MPLKLHDLRPAPGAKTAKTRVGRGEGSKGKTAGRGTKGTGARKNTPENFEGGQMPLHRRLPKRGFTNIFKSEWTIVTLDDLDRFEAGTLVDRQALVEAGVVKKDGLIKVLANGDVTKAISVKVDKVSQGARERILAAGGQIEE